MQHGTKTINECIFDMEDIVCDLQNLVHINADYIANNMDPHQPVSPESVDRALFLASQVTGMANRLVRDYYETFNAMREESGVLAGQEQKPKPAARDAAPQQSASFPAPDHSEIDRRGLFGIYELCSVLRDISQAYGEQPF